MFPTDAPLEYHDLVSEQSEGRRLLLRAVVTPDGGTATITHTFVVSAAQAIVRCDAEASVDTRATVELSFPGLVEPFELDAVISESTLPSGTAELGTWTLAFTDQPSGKDTLSHVLETPSPPSDKSYRVLVVEDNPMSRDVLALGARQFFGANSRTEIVFATCIEDAWTQVQDSSPDLIITDYYLPDGTGDELIRRVRATPGIDDTALVAASVGGEEALQATLDAGADFFIDKPMILRDLFATIDFLRGLKP